jgi:hypothetical protein
MLSAHEVSKKMSIGTMEFQPKLPTAHFAEICQLLFGAAVECRYMMRRN